MAASDIQKHFKSLRVETGRRKSRRDPFADTFDDDSDEERNRRSRYKTKQSPPAVAPAAKNSNASPSSAAAADTVPDNKDALLDAPKRTAERRPSPAPSQLPLLRVSDGAGRRGSLDKGLQSFQSVAGRGVQTNRNPRSAVAQAAGSLAFLDDSDNDEEPSPPPRANRYPSPAPRKQSDPVDPLQRSSTPKGSREPTRDALQTSAQPSLHTVASPFAGTKYLQDSDSDEEEAVASRQNSVDERAIETSSPDKTRREVKRVEKPKQHGSGGLMARLLRRPSRTAKHRARSSPDKP